MRVNTCIFCKSTNNLFFSVEHIFPESLGNKEKILPKGVVCDTCNNETLSRLDQALVEFEPIQFLRTINGIESKRGKVPTSSFNNIKIENPTKSHISINSKSKKNISNQTATGFQLNFRGNKNLDDARLKLIARSLYKIGLELVCLDHGVSFALSERFDEIRDVILGKKDFRGYLIIGSNGKPDKVGVTYRSLVDTEMKEFFMFDFNYMFIRIIFDMEKRLIPLENNFKLEGFTVSKF